MRSVFISSVLFVAACSGGNTSGPPASTPATVSTAAPSGAPEAAAPAEPVVGPPDVKWADMTPMQKGQFMKAVVLPRMKERFVAFDKDTFAKFSCATCHGKDAKERQFKMPNPDIFVLPGDQAGFAKLMQDKPEWVKFMGETVKPEMAKLLDVPEFDPKNPVPGTFGCFNCHTSEKK